MPTLGPTPDDRTLLCEFCGARIEEHKQADGRRARGRPRNFCKPVTPGERSDCEALQAAIYVLEHKLPDVLQRLTPEDRRILRSRLFGMCNTSPQVGFNGPEWQARAKAAQARKRQERAAAAAAVAAAAAATR